MVVAERRTRDFETPVFHERFGRVPASKIVFLRRKTLKQSSNCKNFQIGLKKAKNSYLYCEKSSSPNLPGPF